ncbi:MAG: hypothetical protein K8R57_05825 [Verrucomicrobia bacterium]|nr:hypothetical protein [Verrucomicrobiota bacterium]
MKTLLRSSLLSLFLLRCAAALAQQTAASPTPELLPEENRKGPPMLTVDPSSLLAAFPPVSRDWQLKRSDGRMDVSVQSLPTTVATRAYRVPVTKEMPEFTLTIKVVDLGSQTSTLHDFQNQLLRADQASDSKTIPFKPPGGSKGLIKDRGNDMWRFDAPGARRFVFQIDAGPMTQEQFKALLGALDLSGLLTLEKTAREVLAKGTKFAVQRVDEMNPANTRNSTVNLIEVKPNEKKGE